MRSCGGHDACEPNWFAGPAEQATPAEAGPSAPLETSDAAQDDEASLWRRWSSHADAAAKALLVQRYMPYARALAFKLHARRPDAIHLDEYVQFAMVGLMESVGRYAPGRGVRFTTFATPRIRGAVLNGLERLTERQPRTAPCRRLATGRAAGLAPDGVTAARGPELLADADAGEIGTEIALGFFAEDTAVARAPRDGLPDTAHAEAQLELRQLHQRLWRMVERLTGRERDVVEMHYKHARRFDEIAEELHLSKGRISQLHRQAVIRLRSLLGRRERCQVTY